MLSYIYNLWQLLKSNLWFIPAITCLIYLAVVLSIYYVEINFLKESGLPEFLFSGSSQEAKSVTITLLSSMITMATLAISVTMVVLSLAANQLGPRLIKTFMSDYTTKVYISLFFGAIVACFTLMIILHYSFTEDYVPKLTTTIIFIICFANLFVLLAFVNHVAQSSIADNIIVKVSQDLHSSLNRLTLKGEDAIDIKHRGDMSLWPKDFESKAKYITLKNPGYIQNIDYEKISSIASKHNLYIKILFNAGHFIVCNEQSIQVYASNKPMTDEIDKELRSCFIRGNSRTPTQDIGYSYRHLVEIALRALSPGINDNFTAITVIDYLTLALSVTFEKKMPSEWYFDEEGKPRVWAAQNSEHDIIFHAYDQIRQNAINKPDILYHLLKKLSILSLMAKQESQQKGILEQVHKTREFLSYNNLLDEQKDMLENMCLRIESNLNQPSK